MSALHFGNPRLTLGEKGAPITFGKGVLVPPAGYQLLKGPDGLYLKGSDGAYLYGVAK